MLLPSLGKPPWSPESPPRLANSGVEEGGGVGEEAEEETEEEAKHKSLDVEE